LDNTFSAKVKNKTGTAFKLHDLAYHDAIIRVEEFRIKRK